MGGIVGSIFGGGESSTPDPYAVAAAQGTANTEAARTTAALNRANQYTPWGNQTWSQGGNWDSAGYQKALDTYNQQVAAQGTSAEQGGSVYVYTTEGTPVRISGGEGASSQLIAPDRSSYGYNPEAWSSTVTLSPAQQALLDQQNKISQGLGSAQEATLGRVQQTFGQGIDTSGITQRITPGAALQAAGSGQVDLSKLLQQTSNLADTTAQVGQQSAGNYGTALSQPLPAVERVASVNPYQTPGGGVPEIERVGALTPYQRQTGSMPTSNETYRQQIQDALYKQQQSRLDPRYAQAEADQAASLAAQGITQGSEAYNREAQNLSQAKNDAYQSAMNNAISGGEAAIAGQYGRDLSTRQQGVTEENAAYSAQLAGRGQDLLALSQYYNQGLANRQQIVGEANQAYQNALASQQQNLLANNQYFSQGLANRQQAGNEYSTAMGAAQAGQAGQQSAAQTALQQSALQPQIAQNYANLYGNQRSQEIGEQQTIRNQILNELNALRSGAQVTTPTFGSAQSGANVAASPIASNVWNAYNADQAQNTSSMNGLLGLGKLGLSAYTGGLFG